MTSDRTYILPLDYGNRTGEREFIREVLRRYDRDTLVGCGLLVNNNPYRLQAYLFLNFWSKSEDFEAWLSVSHPKKRRDFRFLFSEMVNAIFAKGFNVVTFLDESSLDEVMTEERNAIFLIPSRAKMDETFGSPMADGTFSVFLSHSSMDKPFVDKVFSAMHSAGIRAWYDRYEITPGDSITDRINEGLERSSLGLLFLSKHFLDPRSGWTQNEANFFFQRRMRDPGKRFIVVNLGVSIDELPAMLRDYKFIDASSPTGVQDVVDSVSRERAAA